LCFPAQALADSIDLATISDLEFGRVPYILILLKLVQVWRAEVRYCFLSASFCVLGCRVKAR
jgi:hypothetical protein